MLVTLDFETYYAKDYSLKKLGVLQYVRDARFKVHGVGIQIDDQPAEWWTDNIASKLQSINWSAATLIGHNLYFDATILFEHYGIVPARRIDTMSIARALLSSDESVSLNNVASACGLGHKIAGTLDATKGIRDLDPDLLAQLGVYCLQDVALTRQIYDHLSPHVIDSEKDLIDLTLRMATAPILELDQSMCRQALIEAQEKQQAAIANSGVDKSILSSNDKFAKHLESLGLIVPTKISLRTRERTYALGQNDPEFIELMVNNPQLNPLWAGRAAAKSSINVTRAQKWEFIRSHGSCKMPMPLNYYGAHTGRWSGMDGINVQNLPRGSLLRKAIHAPDGHVVIVGDSSQIELRMNAWFSGQTDVLEAQRKGECVYRKMASAIFDKPANEVTADERQFGKIVVLGCGYGMGPKKFKHFCASGPLGMNPIQLSDQEAGDTIAAYRKANPAIVKMWRELDDLIATLQLATTLEDPPIFKCLSLQHEKIVLPNKNSLIYENLHDSRGGWRFGDKAQHPLWGGTLLENIIQALARIVVADQMLLVDKLPGVQVVGCTHDEIIAVCPERYAEIRFNQMIGIMSQPPSWAPDLPLAAEGGWARNYSK
jgi:DNA polymerase